MVRILLAAAGAVVGLVLGALLRPSMFGRPVPLDVLVSSHPMDAPFRAQILQTFTLTILGGVTVALFMGHLLRRHASGARLPRR
ncbi:hypothetical protein [Methylobacterium brachiatum]